MRTFVLAISTPERPPSPPTLSNQLPSPPPSSDLNAQVPLSWVPPMISPKGFFGFIDKPWNWRVAKLLFMLVICVGTALNHCRHWESFGSTRPRVLQLMEALA